MIYRVLYEAPFTATLMRLLGALIMLPFGLALGSAFLFGVPNALSNVYTAARSDPTTLLVNVPMTLFVSAFCAFLTDALLRHGGASFLDLLGARTTVVGPIASKRTGRTGKGWMYSTMSRARR